MSRCDDETVGRKEGGRTISPFRLGYLQQTSGALEKANRSIECRVPLSSDPHAWLRPYFAALRKDPAFLYLSPSHQFAAIVAAIASEHPSHAAAMREWSPAGQEGFLKWMRDVTDEQPAARDVELWSVHKDGRTLRCIAVYVPIGIDVRLMDGADFRRTQLVKDAPESQALSESWREALIGHGWTMNQ
jgi:hypothetical protein